MDKFKKIIERGFIENYLSGDIEDIRENLTDFGVNLGENSKKQDKLIKQLKFKLNASINQERDKELLQMAVTTFKKALVQGLDRPVAYLNQLIKENQLTVQHKNLKKLSKDEIQEIIKDQNLIEIIEQLEDK